MIHEQATMEKLSSGSLFSKAKWQERFFDLTEKGISQCKSESDMKNARMVIEADNVKSVELTGDEITVWFLNNKDGDKYQLRCDDATRAQKWCTLIQEISPAGVAERKAKEEAEEKTRKEAAEKAKKEAEEKVKREAEEKARKEAEEEQAKQEAEEQAKKEAEEQAKKEAEEQAKKEADEQAKKEAEGRAKEAVEEQVNDNAEATDADAAENELADMWGADNNGAADEEPVEEPEPAAPSSSSPKAEEPRKVPAALTRMRANSSNNSQQQRSQPARPAAGSVATRTSTSSGGDGSVFDRLSSSYTGTSKYRRAAVDTQRGGFRGMDGHCGRQSGTGNGGQGSWLDVGMRETRAMDYDVGQHKTIGAGGVRGGCMSKLSVSRFQALTAGGHYRSKADLEEAAQRDIECVDKSSFTQFASAKSQFGTHSGMGMGGKIGRFSQQLTASGHIRSGRDIEDAAKRDYLESESAHTSCFNSTKSVTTRQGMAMGGAVGRFQATTSASGHFLSKRDQEAAANRDFTLTSEASAATSTFASAMKRGNPNFDFMGGKTGRFQGKQVGASIYSGTSAELGPGAYTAPTTVFNKLPMPARP